MFNYLVIGSVLLFLLIFLKTEREYDYKNKSHVSDYLPWALLVGDGIILNKNGSLQKTFKIVGKDLDSSTGYDLLQMRADTNNILKRLNGDWNLHIEVKREKVRDYKKSKYTKKVSQMFEDIREKSFLGNNEKSFYENVVYLTLSYFPPVDKVSSVKGKLIEENFESGSDDKLIHLNNFKKFMNEHFLMLKEIFVTIKELDDKETLSYLHSCFSQNDKQEITPLPRYTYLDRYISDTPITTGLVPSVGDQYIGAISLLDFPTSTVPCLFNILNDMNVEYRWTTRYIFLDNSEAQKISHAYKRKWSLNRKGLFTAIEDKITKEDTQTNLEVEDRQEEAESMIYDLQNESIGAGYYTFTLILKDKDIKKLEDNLQNVIAKVQNLGFVAVRETLNTLEAFFGSMPGDIEHNVRKPILNTMTFADLMPLSTIWAGESWNKHLNAPPLLYCTSNNSTPFRLGLHQGDVGHTAIFGQTGGGKSVLLCTLASNWLKHENAQVIVFDKGGSSRVLTEAVEGKFYDLGVDRITFQPLANVDVQSEREWAYEWLCDIYTQENIELTGEHKNAIAKALIDISHLEKSQRTLTSYWLSVQDDLLKQGIKQFTNDGNLGRYFDGNKDDFNKNNPWQVFEMDKILASKSAVSPLITYIFHKLEVEMFTGNPTLLILDEFWGLLENKQFSSKIKDWLKTLRKKNVSVVFATQELTDVINSEIKDTILASCLTKIYLPFKQASSSQYIDVYRSFGLNDREIQLISKGQLKRDYFYKSISGNRLFQLNLSRIELAYYGASDPQDQRKCIDLKENVETNEEFNRKWLEYKGIEDIELLNIFA